MVRKVKDFSINYIIFKYDEKCEKTSYDRVSQKLINQKGLKELNLPEDNECVYKDIYLNWFTKTLNGIIQQSGKRKLPATGYYCRSSDPLHFTYRGQFYSDVTYIIGPNFEYCFLGNYGDDQNYLENIRSRRFYGKFIKNYSYRAFYITDGNMSDEVKGTYSEILTQMRRL